MVNTLVQNASDVGSIPAAGAICPIFIPPTTYIYVYICIYIYKLYYISMGVYGLQQEIIRLNGGYIYIYIYANTHINISNKRMVYSIASTEPQDLWDPNVEWGLYESRFYLQFHNGRLT